MKYTVVICKNDTGETRTIHETYPDIYGDSLEFMWSEGNYACDCNRAAFFYGDNDFDDTCGDHRFSVVSLRLEDGTMLIGQRLNG